MENWLLIQLYGLGDIVKGVFAYIFPEFPFAGVLVGAISVAVFVYYTLKSGLYEGVKVGVAIFLILTMVLLSVHHMAKIFNPHL